MMVPMMGGNDSYDGSNDNQNMNSNGGSGDAQISNDYASDDEFEEEEVSYNTSAVLSGLFARQYRMAMADIARKEAEIVEAEHEAGELSDGESLTEVRKLRAEVNLCESQLKDLSEHIKRKKLQLENLYPRLMKAEADAASYELMTEERRAWEEQRTKAQFIGHPPPEFYELEPLN